MAVGEAVVEPGSEADLVVRIDEVDGVLGERISPEELFEADIAEELARIRDVVRGTTSKDRQHGKEVIRFATDQEASDGYVRHAALLRFLEEEGLLDAYYGADPDRLVGQPRTDFVRSERPTTDGWVVELYRRSREGRKPGYFRITTNEVVRRKGPSDSRKVGQQILKFFPTKKFNQ